MSASRLDNAFRVRDLLGSPKVDTPSFHQILRQEISEEQDIINELNNSQQAWTTKEWTLNFNCNQSKYQIGVEDFGKPLLVLRSTGNCLLPYIPVPFDQFEQQRYGKLLQPFCAQYDIPWLWSETIEHISFFREGTLDPVPMCQINPMPSVACQYVITYLPGYQGDTDALTSTVMMPEHVEMLRLRVATSLLPYATWYSDNKENSMRRKELADGFAYQLQRKERNYNIYKSTMTLGRDTFIENWAS